ARPPRRRDARQLAADSRVPGALCGLSLNDTMATVPGTLRLRDAGPGQLWRAPAVGQRLCLDLGQTTAVPPARNAARAAVGDQRSVLGKWPYRSSDRRGLENDRPPARGFRRADPADHLARRVWRERVARSDRS